MKKLFIAVLLFSSHAFANNPINFDRGYSEIDQKVQVAAQQVAVEQCNLTRYAKIQKYEKIVDYVDQGLVDIYHSFYLFSYNQGKHLIQVVEPMYPNYNDRISATCKKVK
ncbi:MAG: hypothetical protein MK008_13720 [Bdellovibrionales bacterium]|nr:hypothetical protein [Bdellovibrionales bacterium]